MAQTSVTSDARTQTVQPEQIDLECLTDTEEIVNEAWLLATLLRTSASAFAFNGPKPSPVAKSGEMVWSSRQVCSKEGSRPVDWPDRNALLNSHWAAAQKAVQACTPIATKSICDDTVLFSCPVVLRYRGKNYPKACVTVALSDAGPGVGESGSEGAVGRVVRADDAEVIRRAMESLCASVSEQISARYLSYRDTIERQMAEARLLDEKHRLETVLQSIDVGLCLIDSDLAITWANCIMDRWFGSIGELRGRHCWDLYCGKRGEKCSCAVRRTFESRQTSICVVEDVQLQAGVKHFRLTVNPVLQSDGTVGQVLLLSQDITENLRAVRQTERYRTLVDNADDFVLMSDVHGRIVTYNRKIREVLGYTEQELQGMNRAGLHPKAELDKVLALVQEAMAHEGARGELRLLTKDGREIPTEVIVTYSKTDRTFQAIFRDIADRLSMESELQKRTEQLETQNRRVLAATREKSRFFTSISHELRTPMTSIIGFAEILLEDGDEPLTPTQRGRLSKVVSNAHRLLEMINGLLDLSKIEAGKMKVNVSCVDLGVLVERAVAGVVPLVRDKDIELVTAMDQDLPPLYTDEQKLEQILVNLLSNASKFTTEGQIKVQTDVVREKLHISVSDTGMGIRRRDFKRIFEEFVQTEQPTAKRAGTGLGLAIARRHARLLGGDIKVNSRLGQGSTFTIILPFSTNRSLPSRRTDASN